MGALIRSCWRREVVARMTPWGAACDSSESRDCLKEPREAFTDRPGLLSTLGDVEPGLPPRDRERGLPWRA